MTHNTLKNRHFSRQINERLTKADQRLMLENSRARLLIEAMDEQDLQKASAIIEKLRKMKGKGVAALDSAIETAETQLNKYTGGGPLTKGWSKLKSMMGFDNPLVKFMTFANALEQGFRQMPTILKNNIDVDLSQNLDKKLIELVSDPDKQKTLVDNMLKALSPKGFFGAFKKVPYVDKEQLVQGLLNIPVKNFAALTQLINSGPNTQQVATDLKDTAQAGNDVTTKGSAGSNPSEPTAGTTGTTSGQNTRKTEPSATTGEKPNRPNNAADTVWTKFGSNLQDITGVDERRGKAILKFLADEGLLNPYKE